jgi:hypothetical protein
MRGRSTKPRTPARACQPGAESAPAEELEPASEVPNARCRSWHAIRDAARNATARALQLLALKEAASALCQLLATLFADSASIPDRGRDAPRRALSADGRRSYGIEDVQRISNQQGPVVGMEHERPAYATWPRLRSSDVDRTRRVLSETSRLPVISRTGAWLFAARATWGFSQADFPGDSQADRSTPHLPTVGGASSDEFECLSSVCCA